MSETIYRRYSVPIQKPETPLTPKVYRLERAALKLGMSTKQLLRYTAAMGKERTPMGSQLIYLYTEEDLNAVREIRKLVPAMRAEIRR